MDGRHPKLRRLALVLAAIVPGALIPMAAASEASAEPTSAASAAGAPVAVIVRAQPGHVADAEALAITLGGRITLDLSLIDGFAAQLPGDAVAPLAHAPAVSSVTPDRAAHMNDSGVTTDYS